MLTNPRPVNWDLPQGKQIYASVCNFVRDRKKTARTTMGRVVFHLFFYSSRCFLSTQHRAVCGYWHVLCDWQSFRSYFGSVCSWVNSLPSGSKITSNTDTSYFPSIFFFFFFFQIFLLFIFKVSCGVVLHQLQVTSTVLKGLQWRFVLNFHQASRRWYWAITNISCLLLSLFYFSLYILYMHWLPLLNAIL